jgi:hypothetical protein
MVGTGNLKDGLASKDLKPAGPKPLKSPFPKLSYGLGGRGGIKKIPNC